MHQMSLYFLFVLTFSFCTAFGSKKHVHIRIHVPEIIHKVNHEKIIYKHIKKYKHDEKHYHHISEDVGSEHEYGHFGGGESIGHEGSGVESYGTGKQTASLGSHHYFGGSGSNEHYEGLTSQLDSKLDNYHGSSSEHSGFESVLGASGSAHSSSKSLGSSVISVGHFDFDEHTSLGNDHEWKGFK